MPDKYEVNDETNTRFNLFYVVNVLPFSMQCSVAFCDVNLHHIALILHRLEKKTFPSSGGGLDKKVTYFLILRASMTSQ